MNYVIVQKYTANGATQIFIQPPLKGLYNIASPMTKEEAEIALATYKEKKPNDVFVLMQLVDIIEDSPTVQPES